MGGERERTPDGRGFQTHLEEKEKEADREMRQEDQKCVYEGRTATRERGVAVVEVQKPKINT